MNREEVLILFAYNDWANQRVLQTAEQVPVGQFSAPAPTSHGSLRGTLVHVLSAEWMWRTRAHEGLSPTAHLSERDFPTLLSLEQRWQQENVILQAYLDSLQDSDLGRAVRYTNTRGASFETPLWQILAHVVNHGTQFRGEAALVLTTYGHSPGDLDLIYFLRDVRKS